MKNLCAFMLLIYLLCLIATVNPGKINISVFFSENFVFRNWTFFITINIFKAEWGQGSSLGLSKVLFSPDRGLNNTLKQQIIFFIHYVNSDKLNMILTKIVDCISF